MRRDKPTQSIQIKDASSAAVAIIAPQLGSDKNTLMAGRIDNNRLTHINEAEVLWLAWFQNIPPLEGGDFAQKFADLYKDLRMSTDGRRAALLVKALGNITGHGSTGPPKDNRSFIQKHLTERGKEPVEE
jgi:hypothetical protein